MPPTQIQTRQVGDTRVALAATLKRPDNTAVDVTGLTVKFRMCTDAGVDKVAETSSNVTVTDATAGEVKYTFQAADVDTAGTFHAYFIVETGAGAQDTFPVVAGDMRVKIQECS